MGCQAEQQVEKCSALWLTSRSSCSETHGELASTPLEVSIHTCITAYLGVFFQQGFRCSRIVELVAMLREATEEHVPRSLWAEREIKDSMGLLAMAFERWTSGWEIFVGTISKALDK